MEKRIEIDVGDCYICTATQTVYKILEIDPQKDMIHMEGIKIQSFPEKIEIWDKLSTTFKFPLSKKIDSLLYQEIDDLYIECRNKLIEITQDASNKMIKKINDIGYEFEI